jgi:glycine oxidase
MTDCLIVGGGIIGMLTARELLSRGLTVTLIDQTTPGCESSWAGGGIISPLYPWQYDDSVTRLATWSQRNYAKLCAGLREESEIDPEYTSSGLLVLEPKDSELAQDWASRHSQEMEILPQSKLMALEPALQSNAQSAIWMGRVAQVRNPRLVKAARKSLEGSINILDSTQACGFIVKDGQLEAVETNRGPIKTKYAVICAGAWTGRLLREHAPAPRIEPVLGQMILFKTEANSLSRIVLHNDRYVIPRRDGRVLVGSTLERRGFEKTTTEAARESLKQFALNHFPLLAGAEIEHQWAGLRPGSPNGIPYICPLPGTQGLFINAGHFRNGVVLAPASARLMADLVTQASPILDPTPYAFDAHRD